MSSRFKLSNKIFSLGLNPSELTVYAYMSSLPSLQDTLDGKATITVKQSTIAQNCGIKAVQTVSKVITFLTEKGLVEPIQRNTKRNGYKGTYIYTVKKLPTNDSFFFVERRIFGSLVPRQIMIYLFICKAYSTEIHDSWNSYNDIAVQTGMKRETVIQTIAELESMKLIRKSKRKARNNRRVYVDNHYIIIFYVQGRIRKCKKIVRMYCEYTRTTLLINNNTFSIFNSSTKKLLCQEIYSDYFYNRGSPQI